MTKTPTNGTFEIQGIYLGDKNMKNGLKVIIFSLAIVITGHLSAVIPEIEIWADKDNEHFLYLLKDIHLDYKGAKNTIQQQLDILAVLQHHKDSFIIVEDPASLFRQFEIEYNLTKGTTTLTFPSSLQEEINTWNWSQHKASDIPSQEEPLYYATPLEFLAHFCTNRGINTSNIECSPCITNYESRTYANEKTHKRYQQKVHDNLRAYTNDLRDNSHLRSYCKLFDQQFQHLQSLVGSSDKDTFASTAHAIRYPILAARILYQLLEQKNIAHGYVVTGADHIENIKQDLEGLGYKHAKTIGTPLTTYTIEFTDKEKNNIQKKLIQSTPYSVSVASALNLHKTFTEIFNEQKPLWQKMVPYLIDVWMKIR